jgi:hypothetical protein
MASTWVSENGDLAKPLLVSTSLGARGDAPSGSSSPPRHVAWVLGLNGSFGAPRALSLASLPTDTPPPAMSRTGTPRNGAMLA